MTNAKDFVKRELSFFKNNHEYFRFDNLTKAYAAARELGYLSKEALENLDTIQAWCEFLKQASTMDAGFAQGIVLQSLTHAITGSAEICAYPPYLDPNQNIIVHEPSISGRVDAFAFADQAKQMLLPIGGEFYFLTKDSTVAIQTIQTLGTRTCPLASCEFKNTPGKILPVAKDQKNELWKKIYLGAAHVLLGLCEGAMDTAVVYASERVQGGRKIMAWSEHKLQLADFLGKTRTAGILLRGSLAEIGALTADDSRTVLLNLQELASEVTSFGVQALGGAGYMKDYLQEKRFRDAHQLRSWFGSPQVTKIGIFERITHLD